MRNLLIALATLLSFAGCSRHYAPLETVTKVDLDRYAGTWFEIARYEHSFEKGCSRVSATYTLKDNGTVKVVNRCTTEAKKKKEAVGVAYATDASNSRLKVSFFRPFYGDYWIIMLDKEYRYAVVGDPSREYLWILSRTPELAKETTRQILKKLPALGYDPDKLLWTQQGSSSVMESK
ncbi:MAG: lipocalin family protein [Thiovulaceae bacterium]|nr:lipocalin family protein [Sulfurimonadaceae bacterium]